METNLSIVLGKEEEQLIKLKAVLSSVANVCKKEAEQNALQIPINEFESRFSNYTGLSKNILHDLLNNEITDSKTLCLDVTTKIAINKCLLNFYIREQTPDYKQIYQELVNHMEIPEFAKFRMEMMSMGFNYKKLCNNKMLIMEDPKNTFDRCLYLNKIKNARKSNKHIYYIDERVFSKDLMFKKFLNNNLDVSFESWAGYIILYAISQSGYTNSLTCFQVTEQDFNKWVVDILLQNLTPSSIIVMDKNPLHGTSLNKLITRYHSKGDMLQWLKEKNIPYAVNMSKAQLYELIRKLGPKDEEYNIDRVLKAHGHDVIRLPHFLNDLTPSKFMWEYITPEFKYLTPTEIKCKLVSCISLIPQEKWIEFTNLTEKLEDEILGIDAAIEKALEKYELDL